MVWAGETQAEGDRVVVFRDSEGEDGRRSKGGVRKRKRKPAAVGGGLRGAVTGVSVRNGRQ